jgi:hypothetical protein
MEAPHRPRGWRAIDALINEIGAVWSAGAHYSISCFSDSATMGSMNEQQLIGLCLLVGAVVIVAAFFAAGSAVW